MNDELPKRKRSPTLLDVRFASRPHVYERLQKIADLMDQAIAEGGTADEAEARAAGPQSSGSDVEWNAIEPGDTIEPARFATWVFTIEDKGTRIKR